MLDQNADTGYVTEPYQDLAYWLAHGHDSGDIFRSDGSLQSGWSRTAKGYEYNPQVVGDQTATPPPSTPPPSTSGKTPQQIEQEGRDYDAQHGYVGGYMANGVWVNGSPTSSAGGSDGSGGAAFAPIDGGGGPAVSYPTYQSAGAFAPRRDTFAYPDFAFDAFTPSNWSDAENEPGYKDSRDMLRKQVEQGAANRGILRSGMTLGDVYKNLDNYGQQNFAQFDARRFRNYDANRKGAFDAYTTNYGKERNKFLDEYGIDKDIYGYKATDVDRSNNYAFNVADAQNKDALARWQEQVRSLTTLGRPVG